MAYRIGLFVLDGDDMMIVGVYDPEVNWNGWYCPIFDRETVETYLSHQILVKDIKSFIVGDTEVTVWHNDDDFDRYPFFSEEGIDMCMLGGYGWVWTLVEVD